MWRIEALEGGKHAANATVNCDFPHPEKVTKFPWPPEFTDALREIFTIMGIVSGSYPCCASSVS